MAKVKAFKAIRPTRDKAYLVASRSYLSYSEETLREKLNNNPYTFLHIINPEYSSNSELKYGIDKYEMVKDKFKSFQNEGYFKSEDKACLYIYQQIKEGRTYTGIISATSVDDYLEGNIKIHEQTIAKREEMFKEYLDITGFNAEPVLLTYPRNARLHEIYGKYMQDRPEYEFTTTNKVLHNLWLIDYRTDIDEIEAIFQEIDSLYIADGHHRSASSALLCKEMRAKNPNFTGEESFNYFMSFLIDDEQLSIFDFNRIVSDLNGLSIEQFLAKVSGKYDLSSLEIQRKPSLKDEICMYLNGSWYSLIAKKHSYDASHCVEHLDPEILSNSILKPILGIKDIRNDKRIEFIDGKQGLDYLKEKVDSGSHAVAFALKPITVEQLKTVADQNEIMPPKSTYIEPKLRSGLTIYSIGND